MRFPGFIGPSYTLNSVNVDCQRCINLYPELNEVGRGKEQEVASLVSTPGLSLLVTLGAGPIRGTFRASNDRLFVVSGNKLYELSSTWVSTELGTLNSSAGKVSMADNGNDLVTVDSADGYAFKFLTNVFAEITDPEFESTDQVTYQDGRFIFKRLNSESFFISDIDAVTFAGDADNSDILPDLITGIISNNRELWLFNKQSTEVWFYSGAADFPFERIQGAFIEHGCIAKDSVAKMDNSLFWLGQDESGAGVVYMARGYQPQRISTHAVENSIRQYDDLSTAVAYAYQENGHRFYVLNFTGADTTWVFDSITNLWHERAFTSNGELGRHRAVCHAYAFETHVVGDYETGKVYALSSSVHSDNGSAITRRRVAPHLSSSGKRIFYNTLQLDVETGVGLDGVGQGTDPKIMMQFSDDGGHSWSNEIWASLGKIGQKRARVIFRRLGSSRDRVFRTTVTDPVKVVMIGADIEFEVGAS